MLNILKIHKEIKEREERKIKSYQQILNKCISKINTTSEKVSKIEDCACFFTVPEYSYGVPLYDIQGCILYIMEHLKKDGCYVEYFHPNIIYINWTQVEEDPTSKDITNNIYNENNQNYRLINDIPKTSLIYHPNDINSIEYKLDNLFD